MGTLKTAGDRPSKQTTKGTRENSSRDVHSKPLALLLLLVPRGQEHQDTRGETGLEDTHDEAQADEGVVAGCEGHADGDAAPEEHDKGQVEGGSGAGEDHVGRDLEEDVGDEEDDKGDGVAV